MSKLFKEVAQVTPNARAWMKGERKCYKVYPGNERSIVTSAAKAARGERLDGTAEAVPLSKADIQLQ